MPATALSFVVASIGPKTIAGIRLNIFLGRKTMAAMKQNLDEVQELKAEIDFLNYKIKNYRSGLIRIVEMESYPIESGSTDYDGLYPTGKFALKVLHGEWPDD
jgi:hypothetical protein